MPKPAGACLYKNRIEEYYNAKEKTLSVINYTDDDKPRQNVVLLNAAEPTDYLINAVDPDRLIVHLDGHLPDLSAVLVEDVLHVVLSDGGIKLF